MMQRKLLLLAIVLLVAAAPWIGGINTYWARSRPSRGTEANRASPVPPARPKALRVPSERGTLACACAWLSG